MLQLVGEAVTNCNTVIRIWKERCPGCDGTLAFARLADGRVKPLGVHCITCHSRRHSACTTCGSCLPEWAPIRKWPDGRPCPRWDKRYCSPACRQKAYRRRKRADA